MATIMDNLGGITGKFKHEPTEIERVQANITQVEGQIQQCMLKIGQMYYRDNQNRFDIDQNYRDIIDMIIKLDENRKGFFAHKLRLEGNMACVNCGRIIPYGSVFCSECGKRADVKEQESQENYSCEINVECKVCPSCNTTYTDGDTKFCTNCGTQLGQED